MKNRHTLRTVAESAVIKMGDVFSDAPELGDVREQVIATIESTFATLWWGIMPPTPPPAPLAPQQFPYASGAPMPPCTPAKQDHSTPLLEQLIAAQDNLTNLVYQTGLADHLDIQFRVVTSEGVNYWSGISDAMDEALKECQGEDLLSEGGSMPAIVKGGYNLQDLTNWLIENQANIEGLFRTRRSLLGE